MFRVYFPVEPRISARKALISNIHMPLLAEAVASESVCTLLYYALLTVETQNYFNCSAGNTVQQLFIFMYMIFFFCRLTMEVR